MIGIDEISVKKRHASRIVVSDLEARRPIWFGGDGRSQHSIDEFFTFLGEESSKNIAVVLMDEHIKAVSQLNFSQCATSLYPL
jgi:transposase